MLAASGFASALNVLDDHLQGFNLTQAALTGTALYDCTNMQRDAQSNSPEQGDLCHLMHASTSAFDHTLTQGALAGVGWTYHFCVQHPLMHASTSACDHTLTQGALLGVGCGPTVFVCSIPIVFVLLITSAKAGRRMQVSLVMSLAKEAVV